IKMISHIIKIGTDTDSKDIILDFFSGSAPTGHATIAQNFNDKGNRKFILVQLPEPLKKGEKSIKTIADLGKSRIKNVIKKIEEERAAQTKEIQSALPGMAKPLPDLDLGFKVFKLDRSNFKVWDGSKVDASEEEIIRQLALFVEHIDPDSSQENILYELLLKAGFMPTEKVEKRVLANKTLYSISDGALLICLEDEITRELIDAVAEVEPLQFICLDRGFKGNDQLKANAVQTFAARNQGRDKAEQIVFRTV
ncbi:MAG: site-specific DNA-methyltransferase, partial [bacterium]